MVRRWSRINNFNIYFKNNKKLFFFKKSSKFRMFKLTVSTRRFFKKYTKFRRKAFNRLRHKTNWLVYSNVFKFWSHDYLNTKTLNKKLWLLGFNQYNTLVFNFNSVKNMNTELFFNLNYHILNLNSFFLRKVPQNSENFSFWKKYKNSSVAFSEENFLEPTLAFTLFHYDNVFYEITENLSFSSDYDFFSFFKTNFNIVNIQLKNFYIFFIYLTLLDL